MPNRRDFIKNSSLAAGSMLLSNSLLAELSEESSQKKLTILHTNDVHSRLEPFPMDGSRNQGLGGVEGRATLIKKIRAEAAEVLLLDAGDIFQGTPYFNFYKGEPEIKAMSAMSYDAATIGNHDFDAGLENLATQLQHANFPVLICNYDMSHTPMENKYQPYKIFTKGKLKIGVTGVGIDGKGLIPENLWDKTQYFSPVEKANEISYKLKKEMGCDMVICLSHLGYKYKEDPKRMCDEIFAKESEHIDVIIGAHTHTFMDAPDTYKNRLGSDVIVNQVGWAGIQLGRLDVNFAAKNWKNFIKSHTVVVGKKTNE